MWWVRFLPTIIYFLQCHFSRHILYPCRDRCTHPLVNTKKQHNFKGIVSWNFLKFHGLLCCVCLAERSRKKCFCHTMRFSLRMSRVLDIRMSERLTLRKSTNNCRDYYDYCFRKVFRISWWLFQIISTCRKYKLTLTDIQRNYTST